MRAATAYFVGAGTIIAAIAIGLGGGIVAGNIMNPISPKQGPDTSRLEHRAHPKVATAAPSEHVPYLAGSQAMVETLGAPAQAEPQSTVGQRAAGQSTVGSVAPPAPQQAAVSNEKPDVAARNDVKNDVKNEVKSANAQPTEPARPVEKRTESRAASENAYARASDADVKRAASEQRRVERRKYWAERRRNEMRASRERTDWDDVARSVREDSESRDWASGPRSGLPQIRLFGSDDD